MKTLLLIKLTSSPKPLVIISAASVSSIDYVSSTVSISSASAVEAAVEDTNINAPLVYMSASNKPSAAKDSHDTILALVPESSSL
jgi:hypothetical protein